MLIAEVLPWHYYLALVTGYLTFTFLVGMVAACAVALMYDLIHNWRCK